MGGDAGSRPRAAGILPGHRDVLCRCAEEPRRPRRRDRQPRRPRRHLAAARRRSPPRPARPAARERQARPGRRRPRRPAPGERRARPARGRPHRRDERRCHPQGDQPLTVRPNNRNPARDLMKTWLRRHRRSALLAIGLALGLCSPTAFLRPAVAAGINTVPGMPPVVDPRNLYSEIAAGKLSPAVAGALPRIYVPNHMSSDIYVIDPATLTVVSRFRVGINPQHVVPSWDLKTLWVANNAEHSARGSLTPIDPRTGKPGQPIAVDDPYNMYFSPDGRSAIVVAEALKRLDFRDPHSMVLQFSLETPE